MAQPDEIWTLETLRIHLETLRANDDMWQERLRAESDKRRQERFQAQEEALRAARVELERRLDGMNEFRKTLSDQAGEFARRTEVEQGAKATEDKLGLLNDRMNLTQGSRIGLNSGWGYL